MNYTQIISIVAFAVIILCALFLFIRNYPSDKEFSVVFVVAGGVLLWCAWGAEAENKIECFYDEPATSTLTDATTEHDENGSIARKEPNDGGVGNGRCERKDDDDRDTDENGESVTSCWGVNGKGICVVKKSKEKEWESRLERLREQVEYWTNSENATEKTVETVELFYDCHC